MSRDEFRCLMCGHCCLNLVDAYRGCVSDADLELWHSKGRHDLLSRVETLDLGPGNRLHLAWIDPETGDDVERCPWLIENPKDGGHSCSINDVKPEHCRSYPEHEKHGRDTGCPGCSPPAEKLGQA